MTDHKEQKAWDFGHQWVLSSSVGYGLGGLFGWGIWVAVMWFFYSVPEFVIFASGGAVAGALIGIMQGRMIRMKYPEMNKNSWMAGNIIGMLIAWVLFFEVHFLTIDYKSYVLPMLAGGVAWGGISGVTQWHLLKASINRTRAFVLGSSLIGILVIGIGFAWIPPVVFGYYSSSGSDIFGFMLFSSFASFFTWPLAGFLSGVSSKRLYQWLLQTPQEV